MLFSKHRLAAVSLVSVLGVAGFEVASGGDDAARRTIHYDIAMNGHSLRFEGATTTAGLPADGTPFVIQGYIYPAGTFAQHGELSGVDANGNPTFPDLVLGTWTCRGWHLQDAGTPTGISVATKQIFDLNQREPGSQTITTDGIELADFGKWFHRTISGGTGEFSALRGQHRQVLVGGGPNLSGAYNTIAEFDLVGKEGI